MKISPQFASGFTASIISMPGIVSWGVISGVAMVGAGLTPLEAMSMSVLAYAGASQLAALQLMTAGAPLALAIVAGFVVNLRFALFSLSISPYLRHLPPLRRALYSYGLTDNGYALSIHTFTNHPPNPEQHRYFFGAAVAVWLAWQAGTALGVLLGAAVPASWTLEFTIILTFIALVLPHIKDRASVVAALTAALVSLASAGLPFRLGLILSAAAAIAAGMLAERGRA